MSTKNPFENKIIEGDSLNILKQIEDNSIDSIVTDPPYGYSFMNKDWDKAVVSVETWKECYRVMKSGSFAFIMSSPRQDVLCKMILNLIDAGFETNFTSIYWTYACLSEDTEVLTRDGWERYHNTNTFKNKEILCFDVINDSYFFENPQKWETYNQIKDTIYRIKSDYTDQIVTRNHRCIVEREGKLLFQFAEELGQTVKVPYLESMSMLSNSILNVCCNDQKEGQKSNGNLLFSKLQTKSQHIQIPSQEWQTYSSDVKRKKTKTKRTDDGRKEQGLERWSNILQDSWKLCRSKIHSLSTRIYNNGKKRWLRNGTSYNNSKNDWSTIIENRSSPSYRPQSSQQQYRQSYIIFEQPTSQEIRTLSKSYKTTLATVTREHYEGFVFCPTVSTGCFVARRNGKIFLTGNSGFPKAANVSKLVDKRKDRDPILDKSIVNYLKQQRIKKGLSIAQMNKFLNSVAAYTHYETTNTNNNRIPTKQHYEKIKQILDLDNRFDELIEREEAEREIIGDYIAPDGHRRITNKDANSIFFQDLEKRGGYSHKITKSATEQAKKLDGSYCGAQLKPAVEVILVVMKPLSEKSFVDQALDNGKGITWLDNCRIPFQNENDLQTAKNKKSEIGSKYDVGTHEGFQRPSHENYKVLPINEKGRFPANLIVSDDSLNDGKIHPSGYRPNLLDKTYGHRGNVYGKYKPNKALAKSVYPESGGYSRYFSLDAWYEAQFIITPKASASERNKGLENNIGHKVNDGRKTEIDNPFQRGETIRQNSHPTVKPLKLMSYLITMGSRENDIILDPFCGSGTTCIAALNLNRRFIGIELNKEYVEIANKRLEPYLKQTKLLSFSNR